MINKIANQLRLSALEMTSKAGSSHIGSMFSIAEIISILYFEIMNINKNNLDNPARDYFYLSKGHAGGIVLAALAKKGILEEDDLLNYYQNGSYLSGHISHELNGVELSTGSLGHALSVGVGVATGKRMLGIEGNVFVLSSDGELNEGSNWEAIMLASHRQLKNLCLIVDNNGLQSISTTTDTLDMGDIEAKFRCFGWQAKIVDGHCIDSLRSAFKLLETSDRPLVVIANTVKGKNVSFMENQVLWHYRAAKGDEFEMAKAELEGKL